MIAKFTDIHPEARIGAHTQIANFVTIESDVVIGENCWIGSGAVIMNGARLGNNIQVFPGAVISAVPQDLKYRGEITTTEIGDGTIIREYCTINKGTSAAETTRIGRNCLIMAYCHVAHDCIIGDNCILANNVSLAGHIILGDYVVIGGLAAVAQFLRLGDHCMIGGYSQVRTNVPPYVKAAREPLAYVGINSIGLKRRGFDQDTIHRIQDMYRIIFVRGKKMHDAIDEVRVGFNGYPETEIVINFLESIEGGIIKGI